MATYLLLKTSLKTSGDHTTYNLPKLKLCGLAHNLFECQKPILSLFLECTKSKKERYSTHSKMLWDLLCTLTILQATTVSSLASKEGTSS
jgi:hypothetical protein